MTGERKEAFEVKWYIENIESWFQTRDDTIYSPQFVAESLTNTCWKLSLSPNWQLAEKCISLTLQRDVDDDGPESIPISYELSFLSCDGSTLKSKSSMGIFASKTASRELSVKEIEIFQKSKEAYLPRNILTVHCTLWNTWSKVSKGRCVFMRSVVGKKNIELNGAIDNFNVTKACATTINFKPPSSEISLISLNVFKYGNDIKFVVKEVKCNCFNWYVCDLFLFRADDTFFRCESAYSVRLLNSYTPTSFYVGYCWSIPQSGIYLQNNTLKIKLKVTYTPSIKSECIDYDIDNYIKICHESVDLEKVSISNEEKKGDVLVEEFKNAKDTEENESFNADEYFETVGYMNCPFTTFKDDLISMYNDRLFCDTKLRNDFETFPAHKCVLSARSPVFKKMFTTDMKEAAGGCINVPDISSDTLRRMLQFFYTDRTGDLEMKSAMDLYVVSDKYNIASLKERVLCFMTKNLRPSNVCEVLVLADSHQDKNLESAASEYVLSYDQEVFGSDEWKIFMQNNTSLAARVMYLKCMKN